MSVQFIASVPLSLVENSCLSSNDHNKDPEYQKRWSVTFRVILISAVVIQGSHFL